MFQNRIKRCISEDRAAWGAALPDSSEFVAKFTINCDVDFVWIDLEHRPYGAHEVRWLPILCRLAGCASMIRVPGLDAIWIKKALDVGADTIMVPQVNTADEAKRAVEFAKYPPQGSRGISPLWTTLMDVSWDDYLPAANDETCVVVQIETPAGIENLDAIAAVEGCRCRVRRASGLVRITGRHRPIRASRSPAIPGRVSQARGCAQQARRHHVSLRWKSAAGRTNRDTGLSALGH